MLGRLCLGISLTSLLHSEVPQENSGYQRETSGPPGGFATLSLNGLFPKDPAEPLSCKLPTLHCFSASARKGASPSCQELPALILDLGGWHAKLC